LHPAPDDSELVERARGGDLDAYGQLVTRHQDQALAAAYVILDDRQEAEDATQEAFTRAFGALRRFKPGASIRAWLLKIVVNEAHDIRTREAGAPTSWPAQPDSSNPFRAHSPLSRPP
jgi:RNA polymerase sigma factor (sigma-70 family)